MIDLMAHPHKIDPFWRIGHIEMMVQIVLQVIHGQMSRVVLFSRVLAIHNQLSHSCTTSSIYNIAVIDNSEHFRSDF